MCILVNKTQVPQFFCLKEKSSKNQKHMFKYESDKITIDKSQVYKLKLHKDGNLLRPI